MLPAFILAFFLRLEGPKVSEYVSTSSNLNLFYLMGYWRSEVGIFLDLTKILVGSSSFFAI